MKQISYDRAKFIQALKLMTFILQVLSVISTFSTFARFLDQYRLPRVFIVLPSLLILLLSIDRCLVLDDKNFNGAVRGAVTGFISGFCGNIANDDFSNTVHYNKNGLILALCNLEFLHIPVIAGTLMCMFCFVFRQFPPLVIVILSMALGVCCSAIFSLGSIFYSHNPESTIIDKKISVLVFMIVFILGIMPSVNNVKQAWLICLIGFLISITWQFHHLETNQWNWKMVRFPIPGFLTSIQILFYFDLVDFYESETVTKKRKLNEKKYDSQLNDLMLNDEDNTISTAIMWHCASYIAERTVLTMIAEHQNRNKPYKTDAWCCCLAMLFVILLYTHYKRISYKDKIVLSTMIILCYICIGVTNNLISNGCFIDNLFGIMFISIFQPVNAIVNL